MGHWQLEHNKYSEIIDGTTSSFLKQFIGKRTSWKILDVRKERFSFESRDGYPRREQKERIFGSLVEVQTPPPPAHRAEKVIHTVNGSKEKIPDSVGSSLSRDASNRSMEPTASRRTIQLEMISTLSPAAMRAVARGSSS
jgi:hypothetical protein